MSRIRSRYLCRSFAADCSNPPAAKTLQLPADLLDLGFAVNESEMIEENLIGSILERVGLCGVQRNAEMPVVPHEAEGHQLDLGKGALLGKKLAELLFGDVIQDHFPVERPSPDFSNNLNVWCCRPTQVGHCERVTTILTATPNNDTL